MTWPQDDNAVERHILRCPDGHAAQRFDGTYQAMMSAFDYTLPKCPEPDCRRRLRATSVTGTYSETRTCDSRCMAAIGPNCSCQCGGANHGKLLAHVETGGKR